MNLNSQSGFTLIETLVAVTILMLGVVGPLFVASRGIADGLFAQNQITASFLAEEAIETVVNRRDSNVVQGLPALEGFEGNNPSLLVNAATGQIVPSGCDPDGCYLNFNSATGVYDVSVAGPGSFRRQVSTEAITSGGPTMGERITVTVWWKNKTVDQHLTLIGYVYGE